MLLVQELTEAPKWLWIAFRCNNKRFEAYAAKSQVPVSEAFLQTCGDVHGPEMDHPFNYPQTLCKAVRREYDHRTDSSV